MYLPEALMTQEVKPLLGVPGLYSATCWSLRRSQSLAVLSSLPEAIAKLLGCMKTALTSELCPQKVCWHAFLSRMSHTLMVLSLEPVQKTLWSLARLRVATSPA